MELPFTELVVPYNELERIEALNRYEILDSAREASFDRITAMAVQLFDVPYAAICLVDADRIWMKSIQGLDLKQLDREPGLCASAILSKRVYVVKDALTDPRTESNNFVYGDFGLRFYAGVPLQTKDGFKIGTICIFDKKPRDISESEQRMLKSMADIVVDELELRLASKVTVRFQEELDKLGRHTSKEKLEGILPDLDNYSFGNNKNMLDEISNLIMRSSVRMISIVDDLMKVAFVESGKLKLKKSYARIAEIAQSIIKENYGLAKAKRITVELIVENNSISLIDVNRIREVLDYLITDAIHTSARNKTIRVIVKAIADRSFVEIIHQKDSYGEQNSGSLVSKRESALEYDNASAFTMSVIKIFIELHGGEIRTETVNLPYAEKIIVSLPVSEKELVS